MKTIGIIKMRVIIITITTMTVLPKIISKMLIVMRYLSISIYIYLFFYVCM